MLKIRNGVLPATARDQLADYQRDVDDQPDYPARVERAKRRFSARNTAGNATFTAVKAKLTQMCNGPRRCMYCEDSVADEVEHFHPKDLYPELVFAWRNYLYACGPCNGPKNNKFSILHPEHGQLISVTRGRDDPVVPPQSGPVALINPLRENPLEFMMLDLRDTFEFTPIHDPGTPQNVRTVYTLDVLRLNARDYLVQARRNAFDGYRARLTEYGQRLGEGASSVALARLKRSLQQTPHPTVWAEMKRQHVHHPELLVLFQQAPRALEF